jgi:predicted RNase H-like nuclease (RuvC/YqgF family)
MKPEHKELFDQLTRFTDEYAHDRDALAAAQPTSYSLTPSGGVMYHYG